MTISLHAVHIQVTGENTYTPSPGIEHAWPITKQRFPGYCPIIAIHELVANQVESKTYFRPIRCLVDSSTSRSSPYYRVDIDPSSSYSSRVIGQGNSIQNSVTNVMTHTCPPMLQATQPIDNRPSGSILEGLESFSDWEEISIIRQLASATMIEFLPLPLIGNSKIFSTGI